MTIRFNNCQEFADHLRMIERRHLKSCYVSILSLIGETCQSEARDRIIGRVTPLAGIGPFAAWTPLRPATIDRKERKGLGKDGDARSILYETGALAASIKYRVERGMLRVVVGTNSEIAHFHEFGFHDRGGNFIGPRPFMGPAMFTTMTRNYRLMQRMFGRTLKGLRL